jgi:hypothetical protein
MRIMRFTILPLLTLLVLAIAIPATATTCSICITDVTVYEDGTTKTNSATCQPDTAGDIPDCIAVTLGGIPECDSLGLVASCGEGLGGGGSDGCPPWGCIYMVKARKMPSMIRPILSKM